MKKLLLISVLSIAILASCGSSDNKKEAPLQDAKDTEIPTMEKYGVTTISYNDFVKNIWDFEKNPNEFVFKGSRPCVVDFYATWCGPCKAVSPIMEKLAKEYVGKVDFYKVDCDKEKKLSMIMQVRNIPMIFFMKDGAQPEKSVGARDEAFYRTQINKLLGE